MKSLGIVFKGNKQRDELRKRIRNMEECTEVKSKKRPKEQRKEKGKDAEGKDVE